MEPKLRETLSNKIKSFESQPARWTKKETWDKIRRRQKKTRYPYYAAAACILVVAVSAGYFALNKDQRIDTIQPQVAATVVEKETPKKNLKGYSQPEHSIVKKKIVAKKVIGENPASKTNATKSAFERETADITFDDSTNVAMPNEATPPTAMTDQKEPETQRPKVIIGIIPRAAEDQMFASHGNKKIKFKVINSSEKKSGLKISEERTLIIARIK